MSRFSAVKKGSRTKTVNVAGGEAFKESSKLELISTLLTTFLTDKYYESANGTVERIKNVIQGIKDKLFVAKAAVYARNKYGMRSVSHLVAGELAHQVKGVDWAKRFYDKVVYRPDDMAEILSYYIHNYEKPIPNSLKKGLAKAFDKFDAYQLGKYRGESHELSLVDVINLVHPKPNVKNAKALEALIKGTLKSVDTWEKELTQAGQKATSAEEKEELKAGVWKKLIKEKKIGYFALLRNLRNILEQAPDMIDEAVDLLTDEKLIKSSLVLPFRFQTAVREIEQVSATGAKKVIRGLNKAIDISCANVPKLDGETLVVLDVSGSMNGRPLEIGSLFAAILAKANDADVICFATTAVNVNINTGDTVLSIAEKLCRKESECGGGTDFHSFWKLMKKKYERIIILSDMQGWIDYNAPTADYAKYKKDYNVSTKVFSFNLNDYGTIEFPEKDVYCLAGWSDKVFDTIKLFETDKDALIAEVEKVII